MNIPRVIPALLLENGEFVKTTQFANPRYIGDPVNTIDLFNQFEVDEIALLDIQASLTGREPPYSLIEGLAAQCWVPLAYGGGIRDLDAARRVLGIGVEKVIVGTTVAEAPDVVGEIAAIFGRQAVVAAVDVLAESEHDVAQVLVRHGTKLVSDDPAGYARHAADLGAGEILLQAIHRDGTRKGFDLPLIQAVTAVVDVPVVALGGAGNRADLARPVIEAGAAAVAAGSLFVFQGRSGGVLVNFPPRAQLESLFRQRDL